MELNIDELNIIISALKLAQEVAQNPAEIKMVLHKLIEEQGDLMAEEHAEKGAKLISEIKAVCKWANDEAVMEYAMEWAGEEVAGVEHFKSVIMA